jgi:hypothetical protein
VNCPPLTSPRLPPASGSERIVPDDGGGGVGVSPVDPIVKSAVAEKPLSTVPERARTRQKCRPADNVRSTFQAVEPAVPSGICGD